MTDSDHPSSPTHCISCGSEVPDHAKFCQACGSAVYRPATEAQPLKSVPTGSPAPEARSNLTSSDLPPVATEGVDKFDLQVGALGLTFRSLGMGIASLFVIPAPWIFCWYYGWFVRRVRLGGRRTLEFRGTPSNAVIVAFLFGLVTLLGGTAEIVSQQNPASESFWMGIAILASYPVSWAVSWAVTRWVVNHTQLEGRSLRFDGSVWVYVVWFLAVTISFLTIIGWAWISAAFGRWIAGHIQGAGGKIRFVGKGHQILWRSVLALLLCVLFVTIPWVIRWMTRWWTRQHELERDTPSMQV